jgi:O-antigen/teichoic acid export membrane protein
MLARERYESYAGLELSHSTTFLVVGAGLAIPFGLTGAAIGLPAAAAVGALVGAVLLVREARRDQVVDSGDSMPRALRFGLQAWAGNLLQQVNYRFDVIILGGFATARDVGIYSVALTLTGVAWVLPQALQTVLFPRTASLAESAGLGEISLTEEDEALARAVRHGVLLTIPTGVLVALLLVVGVPLLYGSSFHETIVLGFILLPGVLALGEAKILGSAIAGRGKPRYALYSSLISMPITVALYFSLIPFAHARGAAVATTVSYLLTSVLTYFFFRKVARIGLRQAFVPGRADLADYRVAAALARERLRR